MRATLFASAFFMLLILALGGWLLQSESGAQTALSTLVSVFKGTLQIEGVHGYVAGSLQLDRLVLELPGQRISLENVRLNWNPRELFTKKIHVTSFLVGHISVASKIDQHPHAKHLPDNIALPIALKIDKIRIDGGDIRWGPLSLIKLGALESNLDFDGSQYRFQLHAFDARASNDTGTVTGNLTGTMTLGTVNPYPLKGEFTSGGNAILQKQTMALTGNINLSGSLAELATNIDLGVYQSRIAGHVILRPYTDQVLGSANVTAHAIDLSAFRADLPKTDLEGELSATAAGNGELTIENRAAGMYDNGKLPLTTFNTKFRRVNDQISFDRIAADLGSSPQSAGKLHGQGRYSNGALDMVLDVDRLDLHRLDQRLHPTLLAGNIQLRHVAGKQHLLLALNEPIGKNRVALNARATMSDAKISIDATELRLGNGHIAASANIDLSGTQAFSAKGEVTAFRLQDLGKFSQLPTLDLSGSFSVQGSRLPKLNTDLAFQIRDSRIGGHPLAGGGRVRVNSERISVPEFLLTAGDNHLDAHGELSQGAGKLSFTLTAPNLAQLGPGFGGTFNGDGTAQGSFQKPHIVAHWMGRDVHLPAKFQALQTQGNADLVVDRSHPSLVNTAAIDVSAQGLQIASQRYEALSAHMQFSPQADAPFMLDIHGKNIVTERLQADNMSISAQGTTSKHIIDIALAEAGARQNWIAHGSGGLRQLDGAAHWQGTIDRFDATGRFVAHLASPAMLSVAEHRIQLDQFRLDANTALLQVIRLRIDPHIIQSESGRDLRLHSAGCSLREQGAGGTLQGAKIGSAGC